jgi:Fe-coproporphyrin III synthase
VNHTITPSALSIEVTNLCNLRCKHCFWEAYKGDLPQRTNGTVIDSARRILDQYPSITNLVWYGGEPLLNDTTTRLVQRGIDELGLKNNLVITNGIRGIPIWRNKHTYFAVSVDGTKAVHDSIRGHKTYEKTRRNVLSAVSRGVPVSLIYCLNRYNTACVPDFLAEWFDTGIRGVVLTMATPVRGKTADIDLSDADRGAIIPVLHQEKARYGDFIYNSTTMIDLLDPKFDEDMANNCMMNRHNTHRRVHSIHMRNDGSLQTPCALGPEADCRKCRSITHVALYAAKHLRDRPSLLSLFRMYHAKYQNQERPDAGGRDIFTALSGLPPSSLPPDVPAKPPALRLPIVA